MGLNLFSVHFLLFVLSDNDRDSQIGLSDKDRLTPHPPVTSHRLGLDQSLIDDPPLFVFLLPDDHHHVGPHHHVSRAGPRPCQAHSERSIVQSMINLYLVLSNILHSSDFQSISIFPPPTSEILPSLF